MKSNPKHGNTLPKSSITSFLLHPHLPWALTQQVSQVQLNLLRRHYDRKVLRTPAFVTGRDNLNFEIHALLGHKHVGMCLWAVKSLLHWAGKRYTVVLHDDGTLTDADIETLCHHLIDVNIIRRSVADKLIATKLSGFQNVYDYRFGRLAPSARGVSLSVFSLKLLDFSLLTNAKQILVLDTDVLFFRQPNEIINWVEEPSDTDCLYCLELFTPIRNFRNKITRFERKPKTPIGFNSGLICLKKSIFDLGIIDDWLDCNRGIADKVYTFEQQAYNHLVKNKARHAPLPETYSFNYNDPASVATHFGIKHLFFGNLGRVNRALTKARNAERD